MGHIRTGDLSSIYQRTTAATTLGHPHRHHEEEDHARRYIREKCRHSYDAGGMNGSLLSHGVMKGDHDLGWKFGPLTGWTMHARTLIRQITWRD